MDRSRPLRYGVIVLGLFLGYFLIGFIYHHYSRVGLASFYGRAFQGYKTASGQLYDMNKLTAAHRRLPVGTKLEVTNLENNRRVIVTVNDRGPYVAGRIIDLSRAAALRLGMVKEGLTKVRIEVVE